MPHTRSAKKNLRKSDKRRTRNRAVKRTLKTYIKRFLDSLEGPVETAQQDYNLAAGKLDQAAAKRVIHPNTAARKKSQLGLALFKKHNEAKAAKPAS